MKDLWVGRYLPAVEKFLVQNGNNGYMVGDKLTHADICMYDVLTQCQPYMKDACYEGFPAVAKFVETISARPAIQKYQASDRCFALRPRPW